MFLSFYVSLSPPPSSPESCFFHAVVRERCNFGPLGWNIPYEFSNPDLRITCDQLDVFLRTYAEVPYGLLVYMTGQCNYGGRVTDDKDRRCIMNIVTDFYTPKILDDDYKFSISGDYYAPKGQSYDGYLDYISDMPFNAGAELFGLHDNAEITCAIMESNALLQSVLSLQPKASSGEGKSYEEVLGEMAADIESRTPVLFDIEKAQVLYPVLYEESMNTILVQELLRFNVLLSLMKTSLSNVQRALKGLVVMSAELELMGQAMVKGRVPSLWK